MAITSVPPFDLPSSGEIQVMDFDRANEVASKHELLTDYMRVKGYDALLLQHPSNFAWLSGGGDNTRRGSSPGMAAILITPEARVILCSNADSGQLFDRELAQMGFLLKERPWAEDPQVLLADVCRGRRVGSDSCLPNTEYIAADLVEFRLNLTPRELDILRDLGRDVVHAVEATARNFNPGESEADVAGQLAHRLIRRQVQPVQLQVMADGQGRRYRHWNYGRDAIERHCVISAVGRRHGLHVSATRTVCIGSPPAELQETHQLALFVQATALVFTQSGWSMEETWKRVARIYEKFGAPDEWRVTDQAELIGYTPCEVSLTPHSRHVFRAGMAVHWHPSVRSAAAGDTMLIGPSGFEVLTRGENWPMMSVSVKGIAVERPAILIREITPGGAATAH